MAASFEAFGSPVVRKIAVAVLAGSVTYAVTNLTDQPQPTVLTLTVLIGGVFLLAQLLVDFEARQRGVEERLASLERRQADGAREVKGVIASEIAHISEATRLYDQISRLSPPAIPLDRLGAVAAGLAGMPRSLAFDVVRNEIDNALRLAERLSRGEDVTYEGEDRDWLWTLSVHAKATIDATSRAARRSDGQFADEGFWNSEVGVRYLEWQGQAVERGVHIRRIFVADDESARSDAGVRRLIAEQRNVGIDARILDASTIRPARRLLIPDIAIFDHEVSYELTPGSKFGADAVPYFVATRLVLDPDEVAKRQAIFDELWGLSVALTIN